MNDLAFKVLVPAILVVLIASAFVSLGTDEVPVLDTVEEMAVTLATPEEYSVLGADDLLVRLSVDSHMQFVITGNYRIQVGDMATPEEKEAAKVLSQFVHRVFK